MRNQLFQLSGDESTILLQAVGSALLTVWRSTDVQLKNVTQSLLRSAAAIGIRSERSLETVKELVAHIFMGVTLSDSDDTALIVGFQLLSALQEELSDAHLERTLRQAVQQNLLATLQSAVSTFLLPLLQQHSAVPFALGHETLRAISALCKAYADAGGSLDMMNASYLPVFVNMVISLCLSNSSSTTTVDAHCALRGFLNKNTFRDHVVGLFLQQLHACLQPEAANPLSEATRREVLVTLQTLALSSSYLDTVLETPSSSVDVVGVQLGQQIFHCIIALVRTPPRSKLLLTFDFWIEVESALFKDDDGDEDEVGSSPRLVHSFFRETVLPQLLRNTLVLLDNPTDLSVIDATASGNEEIDEEDILEDKMTLRDTRLGLEDVLSLCLAAQGPASFLTIVEDHLKTATTAQTLAPLESVLFVLKMSMPALQRVINTQKKNAAEIRGYLLNIASIALDRTRNLLSTWNSQHTLSTAVKAYLTSMTGFLSALPYLLCIFDNRAGDHAQQTMQRIWAESLQCCLALVQISSGSLDERKTPNSSKRVQQASSELDSAATNGDFSAQAAEAVRRLLLHRANFLARQTSGTTGADGGDANCAAGVLHTLISILANASLAPSSSSNYVLRHHLSGIAEAAVTLLLGSNSDGLNGQDQILCRQLLLECVQPVSRCLASSPVSVAGSLDIALQIRLEICGSVLSALASSSTSSSSSSLSGATRLTLQTLQETSTAICSAATDLCMSPIIEKLSRETVSSGLQFLWSLRSLLNNLVESLTNVSFDLATVQGVHQEIERVTQSLLQPLTALTASAVGGRILHRRSALQVLYMLAVSSSSSSVSGTSAASVASITEVILATIDAFTTSAVCRTYVEDDLDGMEALLKLYNGLLLIPQPWRTGLVQSGRASNVLNTLYRLVYPSIATSNTLHVSAEQITTLIQLLKSTQITLSVPKTLIMLHGEGEVTAMLRQLHQTLLQQLGREFQDSSQPSDSLLGHIIQNLGLLLAIPSTLLGQGDVVGEAVLTLQIVVPFIISITGNGNTSNDSQQSIIVQLLFNGLWASTTLRSILSRQIPEEECVASIQRIAYSLCQLANPDVRGHERRLRALITVLNKVCNQEDTADALLSQLC